MRASVRWVIGGFCSASKLAVVSENEIVLIVRTYLEAVRDVDELPSDVERRHFAELRGYCVARVDELLLAGSIDRKTVDSMSQAVSGSPFESPFDGMDCTVVDVPPA